jgi:hypothetical protein
VAISGLVRRHRAGNSREHLINSYIFLSPLRTD